MAGESARFGLRNRPPTPAVRPFELPPRMQPMLDRAKTGLAEPFRGVTTGSGIVRGLVAIEKTGVSLAPVIEAARAFLAALTAQQRKAVCFAIGDEAWRKWSNIHPWLMRHGICLADLDGAPARGRACFDAGKHECRGVPNRPRRDAAQRSRSRDHRQTR